MSIYAGIRMVCMLMATMAFQVLSAQHYIFIEADGQQPFYLKQGNKMVSSSAAGFLILPKIIVSELEFSIGFPKNSYPEVAFYINGTDRDRGFQLKLMEGQGWSLFDRTSLEVIKGESPKTAPIEMQLTQKEEGSFARLLSAATDDKSLMEALPPKDNLQKSAPAKAVTKAGLTTAASKAGLKDSLVKKEKVNAPQISISAQAEDVDVKRLVFVEKTTQGSSDTIAVEIEKSKVVTSTVPLAPRKDTVLAATPPKDIAPTEISPDTIALVGKPQHDTDSAKANIQFPKTSPIIVCDRPIADYKDIRALQKKLLGIASDQDQRNYAVKAFSQKCFNTKQALEIGWFFVDESSRLQLFKELKPLISDKASFGNLEVSFLKEENLMAFRALVAGTN